MVQGKVYRSVMCVYVHVEMHTHVHSLIHAGMSDQVHGKDSFSNFKFPYTQLHKQNTVYFAVIDLIPSPEPFALMQRQIIKC